MTSGGCSIRCGTRRLRAMPLVCLTGWYSGGDRSGRLWLHAAWTWTLPLLPIGLAS